MTHCDVIAALSDQHPINISLEKKKLFALLTNVYLALIP